MGQLLSESDDQLAQWRTQILAAVGENGQVLIEVIPELEQIIGQQPAPPNSLVVLPKIGSTYYFRGLLRYSPRQSIPWWCSWTICSGPTRLPSIC
jgi:hypothetical protein